MVQSNVREVRSNENQVNRAAYALNGNSFLRSFLLIVLISSTNSDIELTIQPGIKYVLIELVTIYVNLQHSRTFWP